MDITGRKIIRKGSGGRRGRHYLWVPGGTVTDLFDELYKTDSINLILPRHEQGLIHEAEGYAKSTGRVGVCLVTSDREQPISLPDWQMPIMTAFRWYVLPDRCRLD